MKKKYTYTKETKRIMKEKSMGNKRALGHKKSKEEKERLRKRWVGDKNPMKKEINKQNISLFNKRWHKEIGHSQETRKIIREARLGKKASNKTRERMRISSIKYLKQIGNFYPGIGKNEKQILDELELSLDKRIIRQYQVIGYFVDGYCKELNLVIEINEISKTSQKQKLREKEIIKELNCNFIRVKDYLK